MPRRVLVTGGGGLIGSHLARRLFRKGHFVRVADVQFATDAFGERPWYSERLEVDLRRADACLAATEGMEWVFHLAAATTTASGLLAPALSDIMRENTLMDLHMLEACLRNRVARFLYASDAGVCPVPPADARAWQKLFTERVLLAYQHDYGLDVRIARYHNIYGPGGTPCSGGERGLASLVWQVAGATDPGTVVVRGDSQATRAYCYVDDCVDATLALMEASYDCPLDIGSDRAVSLDELARRLIACSGKRIQPVYDVMAPRGRRGRQPDIRRTEEVLGWRPRVGLEEGLELTYRWAGQVMAHHKSGRRGAPVSRWRRQAVRVRPA